MVGDWCEWGIMEIFLVLSFCGRTISGKYVVDLHDALLEKQARICWYLNRSEAFPIKIWRRECYFVHPRQLKRSAWFGQPKTLWIECGSWQRHSNWKKQQHQAFVTLFAGTTKCHKENPTSTVFMCNLKFENNLAQHVVQLCNAAAQYIVYCLCTKWLHESRVGHNSTSVISSSEANTHSFGTLGIEATWSNNDFEGKVEKRDTRFQDATDMRKKNTNLLELNHVWKLHWALNPYCINRANWNVKK